MFIIGLDLGQAWDFTALAVVERLETKRSSATAVEREDPPATYAVRHLERWRGVSYVEQVERVQTLQRTVPLAMAPLVVDQTGVGRAVVDQLRAAALRPLGVSIHGGDTVSHNDARTEFRVPKRDLVAAVAVPLQGQRLKIAEALPEAATLAQELRSFRLTIDPRTAHDSYAAWREQDHDDLVLAVALAVWWGERPPPPSRVPVSW